MSYGRIKKTETRKKVIPKINRRYKLITYFKGLQTADRLAYVTVLMTLVFGYWGIKLANRSIDTSVDLKHFDTLLSKTDSSLLEQGKLVSLSHNQIDTLILINRTLTSQLDILSKQYAINLHEQEVQSLNEINNNLSNEQRFKISAQGLASTIFKFSKHIGNIFDIDFDKRDLFVGNVEIILASQINNPFLLTNTYMLKDWTALQDSITQYKIKQTIATYYNDAESLKIRNDVFGGFFFTLLRLSNNTNEYMKEYQKKDNTSHKIKFPSDLYKSIKDSDKTKD